MATLVADVVADVKHRLIIGTAATEPSDAYLGNWTRSAAKCAIGALQPPTLTTATVAAGPAVTVTADQVYYVAMRDKLLLPSEWEFQDTKVQLQRQVADTGDTATVWLFAGPVITSATTSIDTTCIFGTDWLEEVITLMVMEMVEVRRSQTSASGSDDKHISTARVLQDARDRLLKPYQEIRQGWVETMERRLQARAVMGDGAFRKSPWGNTRYRGRVINPNTGRS